MLVSLSTLLHGTLSEKLNWTFRLYDLNGDGEISKAELGNVVVAVHQLMGIQFVEKVGCRKLAMFAISNKAKYVFVEFKFVCSFFS